MELALVLTHILVGGIALGAGAGALMTRKGSPIHRRFGAVFLAMMAVMALTGSVMALLHEDRATAFVGLLTCQLIATGWLAARPATAQSAAAPLLGAIAGLTIACGFAGVALFDPDPVLPDAVPIAFGSLATLAGVYDLRTFFQRRAMRRPQRLRRHLWRLCTALFIASASFFLGQQDEFSAAIQGWAIWYVLALLPLAALAYWMAKTRGPKAGASPA